ncbi:hypothetical protein [Escherichia coli]|uniref:hypothetical protein n=1 Tax=Escherichia coli TaxID=562 RepID=UPI003F562BE0
MTLTKEQAELHAFITAFLSDPMHDDKSAYSMTAKVFRMALASMTDEPVCYLNRFTGRTFTLEQQPGADKDMDVYVPLYTAPPAPVSVPAGYRLQPISEYDAMCATLLQGAEPVKSGLTLREGIAVIRNSGIAVDAEKIQAERDALNSPAIPDDVRRMDWLVSKTVDVREPMVYGSHSLFWSQTITDEEDDYHATKLREQIDAAMAAENAAAPQQEVKGG